jgi:hypothetical protein
MTRPAYSFKDLYKCIFAYLLHDMDDRTLIQANTQIPNEASLSMSTFLSCKRTQPYCNINNMKSSFILRPIRKNKSSDWWNLPWINVCWNPVRKPWKFIQKRNKNKKQKIELIKNMSSFWKSYYVQQNPESKPWNICT